MRILFLSQILPYPLDAGPKTRAYYVLRKLANEHEVTLLSFTRPTDSAEAYEHLRTITEKVETATMRRSQVREIIAFVQSLFSRQPFLITRDRMKEMDQQVERVMSNERFDAIHSDQLWMAPYALKAAEIAHRKGENPLLVLDQHNAVHLIPSRMGADVRNPLARLLLNREARLMRLYESEICVKFDRVVWVTEEDRLAVRNQNAQGRIVEKSKQPRVKGERHENLYTQFETVIPICIDPNEIAPVSPLTNEATILFVGGMHWPPNAEGACWFADEVLPIIKEKLPKVLFVAVGKNPPQELLWTEGIEAPGYVENLEPYWKQSQVFVVPLRAGGGMRVKILDAWAHGLPVVSTSIGAEGIRYTNGKNILIADEPEELAAKISGILIDEIAAQRLALEGRTNVERCYNWKAVYSDWETVYTTNSEFLEKSNG